MAGSAHLPARDAATHTVLTFVAAILAYALSQNETPGNILSALVSPLSVLGVSAGLSNLLSFKGHRVVSLVGLLLGLAVIVIAVLLAFA